MIKIVWENKKRFPKNYDREIEEAGANLDYKENINLIVVQENKKRKWIKIKCFLSIKVENDDDNSSFKKSHILK